MKSKIPVYSIVGLLILLGIPFSLSGSERANIGEYFEKSFIYEAQGNYAASLNSVLQILRVEPKNYIAVLRAGWLNYLNGAYGLSIEYYKKANFIAPDAIEPKLGLLLPLMASKKWKDSKKTAFEILKFDRKNYLANRRLAYILFSEMSYDEAEKQYKKVINWYPSDIEMKLGLAWTNLRMDRKEKAAQYFREVLKVRRHNPNALSGLEKIKMIETSIEK
jgi:tetratricopeptide (TPR) repeat protein